jgi:hypothetical protein
MADVSVQNEGTIFLFTANSEIAREWISENVQEDATYFGGSLVVEHRYALELARGMAEDGLTIE